MYSMPVERITSTMKSEPARPPSGDISFGSEAAVTLGFFFILLVPLAIAGLALINVGLGRARSAAHAMLTPLAVLAIAAIVYVIWGYGWQGYAGRSAHFITIGGKSWNWLAAEPFFLRGLGPGGGPASLSVLLQIFSVSLAALIPLGAGADRWKLSASCASTAVLAGLTYPLFAHWVWGGGWLAQLGANYGLGRGFQDPGGSGTIHMLGGLTALAIAWILGPRRGKYSPDGMPAAIPGHNAIYILFGCMLAMAGWLGLNCAGAILFAGGDAGIAIVTAINTVLSAGSAGLMGIVVTRYRFGRPDVSITANSWVGGLVAIGAGAPYIAPAAAIFIGLIAGAMVTLSIEMLEMHMGIDDPAGAISVHAIAGAWGVMALAIFAGFPEPDQWLAQLVGVATLLGFVLPLTYSLNLVVNRFLPYRAPREAERQGLDLFELGAGAYPEFVTHTDQGFDGKTTQF